MENNTTKPAQNADSQLSLRELVDFVWRLKFWILLSTIVALCMAFANVRMKTPMYKCSTTIMLNNKRSGGNDLNILAGITGTNTTKRIDNEIFLLKTPSMMEKVVDELKLNTRYYHHTIPFLDRIRLGRELFALKRSEYYDNSPFELEFIPDPMFPESMHPSSLQLEFRAVNDTSFVIKSLKVNNYEVPISGKGMSFGEKVSVAGCSFLLKRCIGALTSGDSYSCTYLSPSACARSFVSSVEAAVPGPKGSMSSIDVAVVTITDSNPRRACDILNTLIVKVNDENKSYNGLTTLSTIKFIDGRLADLAKDLGEVENKYKHYQSSNALVNIDAQSQATLTSDMQNRERLKEVEIQLEVLKMINEYITKGTEEFSIIPANIGISDSGLNTIIVEYNTNVAERSRLISNSSANNPRVLNLNTQLADQKRAIQMSVDNLVNIYNLRARELSKNINLSHTQIASIPQQQFDLQQISRKIDVIEPLYLLLQQKREEAQIQLYSEMDNFRVIEKAAGGIKVSPNAKSIFLIFFLIGFCIPVAIVWIRMQLRNAVESKRDITSIMDINVISTLPKVSSVNQLVAENSRNEVSESFRTLRSNLQYINSRKVIQVTSSSQGEGKSFISTNLALSVSHTGMKTLIIGMDIRKPRLSKVFNAHNVDRANTVVGYLIGKCKNLDDLVCPSGLNDNLDVIFAGPVPPNPTELLATGRENDIIEHFRDRYDQIIIDSAPMLPVSDSLLINKYVDMTLYVVRADYTPLSILEDVKELLFDTAKDIKNPHIVLNSVNFAASKYYYGYGRGYGYGYGYSRRYVARGHYGYGRGYGYGYGYGHESGQTDRKGRGLLGGILKRKKTSDDSAA